MANELNDILLMGYESGDNAMAAYAPPLEPPQKFIIAGQEYFTVPPVSPLMRSEQFGEKVYQSWPESLGKTLVGGVTGWNKKFPDVKPNETPREKAYRIAEQAGFASGGLLAGARAVKRASGLSNAVELSAKGADAETVWQKTGWIKGKENKWRFEIDDSKMSLKSNNQDFGKLGEYVEHPELFKQYPELKDVDVRFDRTKKGASFSPVENMIEIGTGNKSLKETFVHEIQHAIQEKEGFAKGGSPGEFTSGYRSVLRDLEEQITEINKRLPKASGTPKYDELLTLRQEFVDEINKIQGEYGIGAQEKGHQQYRRLHGEFEARDAASRTPWPPDMRKAVRPYTSEHEPPGGWIIR